MKQMSERLGGGWGLGGKSWYLHALGDLFHQGCKLTKFEKSLCSPSSFEPGSGDLKGLDAMALQCALDAARDMTEWRAALGCVSARLGKALKARGLDRPDTVGSLPQGDGGSAVLRLLLGDPTPGESEQFALLLRASRGAADEIYRLFAGAGAGAISAMDQDCKRRRSDTAFVKSVHQAVAADAPRPPSPRGGRWPTRRKRSQAQAADADARADAEESERRRWANILGDLIEEAGFPLAHVARATSDPAAALLRGARGRRGSTLRQRVRAIKELQDWARAAKGACFPQTAADFLDLWKDLQEDSRSRSHPRRLLAGWAFFEKAGGVKPGSRLSADPVVTGALEDLCADLARLVPLRRGGHALRLPLAVLISAELEVVNGRLPKYVRGLLWLKLVKVWAVLRWSDTEGMIPSKMTFGAADGLLATLVRTKTTGPNKKVETLSIAVEPSSFIADRRWLSAGWEIWKAEDFDFGRDYFLPLPSVGLDSVRKAKAEYIDALNMSREAFKHLNQVRRATGGSWEVADRALFLADLPLLWSEHSERFCLPSWAALRGVPKDQRDYLGRWGPDGSEVYNQTQLATVRTIQRETAAYLREHVGCWDCAGEADLFRALRERAEGRNVDSGALDAQIVALCLWTGISPQPPASIAAPAAPLLADREGEDDSEAEPPAVAPGTWVVSVSRRTRFRRLHEVGRCWRVPGKDYAIFTILPANPAAEEYDAVCKDCWSTGRPVSVAATVEDDAEEVESDDESSSSSATSPASAPDLAA